MEDGLVPIYHKGKPVHKVGVLILVVMEDGLVLALPCEHHYMVSGLNPCCNGRWSRTAMTMSS